MYILAQSDREEVERLEFNPGSAPLQNLCFLHCALGLPSEDLPGKRSPSTTTFRHLRGWVA